MSYQIGDLVRVGNYSGTSGTEEFALLNGTVTDPTVTHVEIEKPDGTVLVYALPHDAATDGDLTLESTGRFYVDIAVDQAGVWQYREAGTGAVTAAFQGAFYVEALNVVVPTTP